MKRRSTTPNWKRGLALLSLCWGLLPAGQAAAETLAYEGFTATNNATAPLNGFGSGYGWNGSWSGSMYQWLVKPGLTYVRSNHSLITTGLGGGLVGPSGDHGGAIRPLNLASNGPFAAFIEPSSGLIGKAGTDLWFSCLLNPTTVPPGQSLLPGVYLPPGDCGVGFDTPANNPNFAPNVPTVYGQTYFVVFHLSFGGNGNDSCVQYFNPLPGGNSPAGAQGTNVVSGDFRFSGVDLNGGGTGGAATAIQADELRFGTTYPDVAPTAVPPIYILMVSNNPVVVWPDDGAAHQVQVTTNLDSGTWTTLSNAVPMVGVLMTNAPAGQAFFKLQ